MMELTEKEVYQYCHTSLTLFFRNAEKRARVGRREVERRGARRGVSLDWPNVKGDKKREKTARERKRRGKEKERDVNMLF